MGENTSKQEDRLLFLDAARGLVIILMIVGHSGSPEIIYKYIYGFHIPFFFILSGMLFNMDKWQKLGTKELVKRRWKAYIVPYFILSFINLFINVPIEYANGTRGKGLLISTIKHIYWIFYSGATATTTPNCTPLWFLPCLFLSSFFLFYLLKIRSSSTRMLICVFGAAIVLFTDIFNAPRLPWQFNIAISGMTFMYIGYLLKEKNYLLANMDHNAILMGLLIVGGYCIFSNSALDFASNSVGNPVLTYVGAVSISIFIIIFTQKYLANANMLILFGRNTMLFLGFNYAINSYSKGLWLRAFHQNAYIYPWWGQVIIDLTILWLMCISWEIIKERIQFQRVWIRTHNY